MIRLECPRCHSPLNVPERFAGKAVRCPHCNRPIRVPRLRDPAEDAPERQLDFHSMDAIEQAGPTQRRRRRLFRRRMSHAEAAASASDSGVDMVAREQDPFLRICPYCHAHLHPPDPYLDILCTECGKEVPSPYQSEAPTARYADSLRGRRFSPVSFYTGFGSALLYPLPALVWLLLGVIIAMAVIVVPAGIVLAFAASASLNPITERSDVTWVGLFLTVMFTAEGVYFGAINYHILIDSIRSTASGAETPPPLTWNPITLGAVFMGYLALLFYYAGCVFLLYWLTLHGPLTLPTGDEVLSHLRSPLNIAVLGVLTFMVPMQLLGLASGRWQDGLNPIRVARSIWHCLAHYVFLFLIVLVYLGAYMGIMLGVMEGAIDAVVRAARQGIENGWAPILWGLGGWAAMLAAGLFFAYVLGRIFGLFARTFGEWLEFDL